MRQNITLSAEEALVRKTREQPANRAVPEYEALMERLSYARAGRHFSRDELNER